MSDRTPVTAPQQSSRIELTEEGGQSMAPPAFGLTAVGSNNFAGAPAQMVNELTADQITAARTANTALNLTPASIRIFQQAIGVTPSGEFDDATIRAIHALDNASNGQLTTGVFTRVFTQMVTGALHVRLIPLALDFFNVSETDFVQVTHQPGATTSYRVAVPFTTIQLDNTTNPQTLTGAPNRLKNVFLGDPAFTSATAFQTAMTAVNAIQYAPAQGTGTTTETGTTTTTTTAPQLTATQITAAQAHNNFVLNEPRSIRIVQAAIGTPDSGAFDNATVQALATYQRTNAIARTDGKIDRATLDHIVRRMVTAGEREAVLRVAADFFNLNELPAAIFMRHDAGVQGNPTENNDVAGVEGYSLGDTAFANGLDSLGTALDNAMGSGTSMNAQTLDVLLATTNAARQTAMWSNPNAANEAGLADWIRDNFPTEDQLARYLARTDIPQTEKTAAFGQFSVELGRLEYLMGVIYHGGRDNTWETGGANTGPFVNRYKGMVGNRPNTQPWCTMFSGSLKRLLGFREDLSTGGPLIFNSGARLDSWATEGRNFISGRDDFSDPRDFENYSGGSIDSEDFIALRRSVTGAATQEAKQQAINDFFQARITPQPGDILIINTGTTTNAYGNNSSSHTTTVESYNNYTISTIEGNRGQRLTGTTIDLRTNAGVGQVICLVRAGTEFYTENQAAPVPEGQAAPPAIEAEDILRPLRHMVRNLQLIASHKQYIAANAAGASVASMAGGNVGNGTH